jgi:integrase
LKSDAARRDIEIPTQLANLLRAHRKEMLHKGLYRADGFVFSIETGGPIYYRNLSSRGPRQGGQPRLGSNPPEKQKLSMHDLQHTAITHLIRAGADVGQVLRFAGHARPSMTLDKYLHEFEACKVAARLGQAFVDVL